MYKEMIHEGEENNWQTVSVQKGAGLLGKVKSYWEGSCGVESHRAEVSRALSGATFPYSHRTQLSGGSISLLATSILIPVPLMWTSLSKHLPTHIMIIMLLKQSHKKLDFFQYTMSFFNVVHSSQQYEYTWYYWMVHLEMVKRVNLGYELFTTNISLFLWDNKKEIKNGTWCTVREELRINHLVLWYTHIIMVFSRIIECYPLVKNWKKK